MKKVLICLLVLVCLLPALAAAEPIERTLTPDLADAPWCEGIVFDMRMEPPQGFPSAIPMFRTQTAELDEAAIRSLLEVYGMSKPQGERWYNGADRINQYNYVFSEMNHGRYQLYRYPWGIRSAVDEKEHEAALSVCRRFLKAAGIDDVEEPYYRVQRGNAPRVSTFEGAGTELGDINLYPKDGAEQYTGIGFRYTLGGLPVAVEVLDPPDQPSTEDSLAPVYGSMTVSDEGVITQFALERMPTILKTLEPYTGTVCTWEEAVETVLHKLIHHTASDGETHWLDGYTHVCVIGAEPNLALDPYGNTFPVWAVEIEYICKSPSARNGEPVYNSWTLYVDARSGESIG